MGTTATAAPGMWARLVGQEPAVRALREAVERDAFGHAYLFTGPEGVGRMPAALALAASVNCPRLGCGECDVCGRALRRAHPDVHVIEPEGAQILVAQVRELREDAYRSPLEGRTKVFVLEDAERMNAAAANALLKVLEEPPADVVIVLIAGDPDDLPPTIVSRCRRIDFRPLGPAAVREVLQAHYGLAPQRAAWAARVGGNLARALRLANDPDAEARRAAHLALPGRLARATPADAVRVAAEVRAEIEAPLGRLRDKQREEAADHAEAFGQGRGAAAARKRLEDRHKRELRRRELDLYDDVLADLASFYRDLLLAAAGAGRDVFANEEETERIERAGPRLGGRRLLAIIRRIESSRRALTHNAQPTLALEALFMDLRLGGR